MTDEFAKARGRGNPNLAACILGFALGGFIDGILLHQVLQWHHLLSLVEGEALRDLRVQILADGLFHVLMYAIAILGLALLWRARGRISGDGSDIRLVAWALLGFGIWQVIDVAGFHWVMRIHRIRVDVPNPLLWDVGWLVVFAVPSLAAGWWLMRKADGSDESGPGWRRAPAALALLVLIAGPVTLLPPPGASTAVVVFLPGMDAAQAFAAVAAANGKVLWSSQNGDVLAVDLAGGSIAPLYANGAMLVSSSTIVAGCLAWSRV